MTDMVALGLLLVVIAGAAIAGAFFGDNTSVSFQTLGFINIEDANVGYVFLAGSAAGLLLGLGAALLLYGSYRRSRRKVSDFRQHRTERRHAAELERENEALQERLTTEPAPYPNESVEVRQDVPRDDRR